MTSEPSDPDGPVLPAPIEQVVEVFVYAPLGFVLGARRQFPDYVARGRREVGHVHELIVRRAEAAVRESAAALRGLGLAPDLADDPAEAAPAPHEPPTRSVVPDAPDTDDDAAGEGAEATPEIDADHLAIPGYESLSASQVMPRLVSLTADELELVRRYEAAARGRKTILSRIAQLQAG